MVQRTKLLGISMASRANRRILVLLTYTLIAALLAYCGTTHRRFLRLDSGDWVIVLVVVVSRWVFGSIIREQTLHENKRRTVRGMGLVSGMSGDEPEPDERELAVRNSAYFHAFRVLAAYSIFLFLFAEFFGPWPFQKFALVGSATMFLILAWTLPQAIILWKEPDMLVEENEATA
jgi:hypothetical protein